MENQRRDGKSIAQSPFFQNLLKKAEKFLQHPMQVTKLLNDAFKKATANKSVGAIAGEVLENLQLLSKMIKAAMNGDYKGIPNTTIVAGIAVIIYFISPIDLVPDFIPIIGLLDDAALLAWFMTSIKSELDKFKEWESMRPATEDTPAPEVTNQDTDTSFGTPKYSNQPEGTVQDDTRKDI